jgi:acetyl esterase/lipase
LLLPPQADPLISPGLCSDEELAQFPTTVISVGDIDPLIDDSTFFFNRLQKVRAFFYKIR